MYPYFTLFGRVIPMYGILVALGILAAILYITFTRRYQSFPEADAELALIYCAIGAVVGAKLLWLLTIWPEFVSELPALFTAPAAFLSKYLSGGFVFYGGLYGAVLAAWIYCVFTKLPFFELARYLLPVLPLFHGFGRLGCFFMGCCYGCPSERFGIAFSRSPIAPNGVPLLPVQLIEAVAEFILFAILGRMARKEGGGRRMLCLWLTAYGLLRFVLEFFRADDYRGFLGLLSVSQVISLVTILLAIVLWRTGKTDKN